MRSPSEWAARGRSFNDAARGETHGPRVRGRLPPGRRCREPVWRAELVASGARPCAARRRLSARARCRSDHLDRRFVGDRRGGARAWFATGNVLAPPLAWSTSLLAAAWADGGGAASMRPAWLLLPAACGLAALALALAQQPRPRITPFVDREPPVRAEVTAKPPPGEELDPRTESLLRLVLDRALQPVEAFEGFERLDQFQTAALRYQVNFLSYALSMAQRRRYLPRLRRARCKRRSGVSSSSSRTIASGDTGAGEPLGTSPADPRSRAARQHHVHGLRAEMQIALAEAAQGRPIAAEGRTQLRLQHPVERSSPTIATIWRGCSRSNLRGRHGACWPASRTGFIRCAT